MSNLISAGTSEETPLLPSPARGHKQDRTPLPWRQFSIVMLLQVSEPLKIQVISPFVPQVAHKRYYDNENQVGYYVGLLHSLFFIAQVSIVLHWSRISDNIGRKPVVLIGLLELTPSMVSFGLSKTFWTLVLNRCICGALESISLIAVAAPNRALLGATNGISQVRYSSRPHVKTDLMINPLHAR
ncbi:hypothetical protein J132_08750 [Termitomyces sp. J132]|nr:hypothetical protein J132_08750 [Termitomyces sp. J132]